jgi:hypothetical protein
VQFRRLELPADIAGRRRSRAWGKANLVLAAKDDACLDEHYAEIVCTT